MPPAAGQGAPAMPTRSGSVLSRLPVEMAVAAAILLVVALAAGMFGLRARSRMVRG